MQRTMPIEFHADSVMVVRTWHGDCINRRDGSGLPSRTPIPPQGARPVRILGRRKR